ncbi:hypothetical protein CEE45_11560 [Candidatus Heimdallarchaeota archaeon B3_Heim]|nr:MAG: hypothetical protein CEE45_11560 [Candidatus Heimdallarchaeota archaeon B3_Heim]
MCGYTQLYAEKQVLRNLKESGRVYRLPDLENEYCPSCGASFEEGLRRCSKCRLIDVAFKDKEEFERPGHIPCEKCGLELEIGTHTCPACGYRKA